MLLLSVFLEGFIFPPRFPPQSYISIWLNPTLCRGVLTYHGNDAETERHYEQPQLTRGNMLGLEHPNVAHSRTHRARAVEKTFLRSCRSHLDQTMHATLAHCLGLHARARIPRLSHSLNGHGLTRESPGLSSVCSSAGLSV